MHERPPGVDPFRGRLNPVRQGVLSEHFELDGHPNYYIVAEPIQEGVPYAEIPDMLRTFEELSGIRVVPHANVIGLTVPVNDECLMLGDYELDEHGRHKVIFHVGKKVEGVSVTDDDGFQNPEVPVAEAARCAEGLVNFHLVAYERGVPQGDMKPRQMMYGTIDTDDQPRLYMHDLDYKFFHDEGNYDVLLETVQSIAYCVWFITKGRGANMAFMPVVQRILTFLRRDDVAETIRNSRSEELHAVEPTIVAYIQSLNAVAWNDTPLSRIQY